QVVVATVPSLEGASIEDYANRLFRTWRLGEAKINNGVLLLVAPKEREVRIEVGYGLEGTLTDALAKLVIVTIITPNFQQGRFSDGIDGGVDAVTGILDGEADSWRQRAQQQVGSSAYIVTPDGIRPVLRNTVDAETAAQPNGFHSFRKKLWFGFDPLFVIIFGAISINTIFIVLVMIFGRKHWLLRGVRWSGGGSGGSSSSSRSSGSSFSGRGGSSGGGGASGKW
ncbi:MAG: hypothetical protein K0Q80_2048, partial [Microvirga sp.]|nr:hypothetical protein [Microvirga sp.]